MNSTRMKQMSYDCWSYARTEKQYAFRISSTGMMGEYGEMELGKVRDLRVSRNIMKETVAGKVPTSRTVAACGESLHPCM
jgi:hypothetical protein